MSTPKQYTCAICGYISDNRSEFIEFRDPVKADTVVEKARGRGRSVKKEDVRFICLKCSVELYGEEIKQPRPIRITCPRCGEVIEVWL